MWKLKSFNGLVILKYKRSRQANSIYENWVLVRKYLYTYYPHSMELTEFLFRQGVVCTRKWGIKCAKDLMQFTIILNALIFLVQMQCENALCRYLLKLTPTILVAILCFKQHTMGSKSYLESQILWLHAICFCFSFKRKIEKFRKYLVKLCKHATTTIYLSHCIVLNAVSGS